MGPADRMVPQVNRGSFGLLNEEVGSDLPTVLLDRRSWQIVPSSMSIGPTGLGGAGESVFRRERRHGGRGTLVGAAQREELIYSAVDEGDVDINQSRRIVEHESIAAPEAEWPQVASELIQGCSSNAVVFCRSIATCKSTADILRRALPAQTPAAVPHRAFSR